MARTNTGPFFTVPEFNLFRLSNKIPVLHEYTPFNHSVLISIWIKVGSAFERPEYEGLSHFLEHMVFKRTGRRGTYHISTGIESVGGYINALTEKEFTAFYTRIPKEQVKKGMDILTDMVFNPDFQINDIEKEKQVIVDEIQTVEDIAEEWIEDLFEGTIYNGTPFAHPISGQSETVLSFSIEDLKVWHRSYLNPDNIVVVVNGNIQLPELREICEKYFSGYAFNEKIKLNIKPYPVQHNISKFEEKTRQQLQTHIMMGMPAPGINEPFADHYLLLNGILGAGMSSRLNMRIRERFGYCYSINSFYNPYLSLGSFGVYAAIDPVKYGRLLKLIEKELKLLQIHGPGNREFSQVKKSITGALKISHESLTVKNFNAAKSYFYYDKVKSIDQLTEEIDKITYDSFINFLSMTEITQMNTKVVIQGIS